MVLLSAGQLTRAASQAVRVCAQQGNWADGLLILNSIRYAATPPHQRPDAPALRSLAHHLRPDCSPRLPAHALLHGLIRAGKPQMASKLATQMIDTGIPVRATSLTALYRVFPKPARKPVPPPIPPDQHVLALHPHFSSHSSTQHAIHLLNIARERGNGRTRSMFETLITLCIINGEIILASLVFGILVRDWQVPETPSLSTPPVQDPQPLSPAPFRAGLDKVCTSIRQVFLQDSPHPLSRQASLQALANLAYLLDHKLIPLGNISSLLTAISKCPRGPELVWIPDPDRQVNAYEYLHDVVRRLLYTLPSHHPPYGRLTTLPPVSLSSYNALLQYSLHHHRSIDMAKHILHHMTCVRDEPLEPNDVTRNIINRFNTIMRQSNVSRELSPYLNSAPAETPLSDLDSLLALLPQHEWTNHLPFDTTPLTIRMTHLISTGRPSVVVDFIPHLFPSLAGGSTSREEDTTRAAILGPYVLTCLLNAVQKTARTGIAENLWALARKAERLSFSLEFAPSDPSRPPIVRPWCLPVHAYTIMIKVYGVEVKKGMVYRDGSTGSSPDKMHVKGWGAAAAKHFPPSYDLTRWELGRYLGIRTYLSIRDAPRRIHKHLSSLRKAHASNTITLQVDTRLLQTPEPDARFYNAILGIVGVVPGMVRRSPRMRSRAHWKHEARRAMKRWKVPTSLGKQGEYLTTKQKLRRLHREAERVMERKQLAKERRRTQISHRGPGPRHLSGRQRRKGVKLDGMLLQVADCMMKAGFVVPLVFQTLLTRIKQSFRSRPAPSADRRPYIVSRKLLPVERTVVPVQYTKGRVRTQQLRQAHSNP